MCDESYSTDLAIDRETERLESRIDEQQRIIDALVAALEPFAKIGQRLSSDPSDADCMRLDTEDGVTFGDFRRAGLALALAR